MKRERLHKSLGARCSVIGVAKSAFSGGAAIPVLRGHSRQPLFVSAVGMNPSDAAARVGLMHGAHRIPSLLKHVDLIMVIAVLGFPFDAAAPDVALPPFVNELGDALIAAGGPPQEVEGRLLVVRRWVEAERGRYLDEQDLAHNPMRRMAEFEREAQCIIPPRLRDLWLNHAADARSRGVDFEDPLGGGCFRDEVSGAPEPTAAVERHRRVLLFATLCGELEGAAFSNPDKWDREDQSLALDLGRPIRRDGYVDYPVLLVADGGSGSFFLGEVAAASDDWLR